MLNKISPSPRPSSTTARFHSVYFHHYPSFAAFLASFWLLRKFSNYRGPRGNKLPFSPSASSSRPSATDFDPRDSTRQSAPRHRRSKAEWSTSDPNRADSSSRPTPAYSLSAGRARARQPEMGGRHVRQGFWVVLCKYREASFFFLLDGAGRRGSVRGTDHVRR